MSETGSRRPDLASFVRMQRVFNGIAAVFMVIVFLTMIVTFAVLIQTKNASSDTRKTLARVESCTTVEGTCYRDLQTRGGGSKAVQQVMAGYLTIAKCGKVTDTPEQLEACVKSEFAPSPIPTPTPTPTEG